MRRTVITIAWVSVTAVTSAYLAMSLTDRQRRRLYLPGATTGGHHQIEERCELCHSAGDGVTQDACLSCHREELDEADDSHPASVFLDPRNAAMVRRIDGRRCVSCHLEHRPGSTGEMGVTVAQDFCAECHADVARDRPSHRGLAFDGCQAVGCHNYHDNRALAETYLAEHTGEADLRSGGTLPSVDQVARDPGRRPLGRVQADAPAPASDQVLDEWLASAHARAGVNCTDCHGGAQVASAGAAGARAWSDRPAPEACRGCHDGEVDGFLGGKHGMRLAADLPAMTPGGARLPMVDGAEHRELGCSTCHGAHAFDVRRAAVDACLECHADAHSLAYRGSPHEQRWALEARGAFWPGSGVSCATCHMPRVRRVDAARPGVLATHDQNAALRPVETMVRPVCAACHGVGYSLAALADRSLVEENFRHAPAAPAASMEMVRRHEPAGKEQP